MRGVLTSTPASRAVGTTRALLCHALSIEFPCPEAMVGAMASVPLPAPEPGSAAERLDNEALTSWFRERGVETWLHPWRSAGGRVLRASAQLYNSEGEFVQFAGLLREAMRAG